MVRRTVDVPARTHPLRVRVRTGSDGRALVPRVRCDRPERPSRRGHDAVAHPARRADPRWRCRRAVGPRCREAARNASRDVCTRRSNRVSRASCLGGGRQVDAGRGGRRARPRRVQRRDGRRRDGVARRPRLGLRRRQCGRRFDGRRRDRRGVACRRNHSRRGRLGRHRGRRGGRRCGPGRRDRRGANREEPERVDVALFVGHESNAEVHVEPGDLRVGRRADDADGSALRYRRAAGDRDRAEVRDRHGVSVGRVDRDAAARSGHDPGEGDASRGRCDDRLSVRARHVDAAMLAGGIRMGVVEGERLDDGPSGRPRPGGCRVGEHEVREDEHGWNNRTGETSHRILPW